MVRGIEKFAFTYIIADILILITAITIVVFATIHYNETGHWGSGIQAVNTNTWLTMIGSAIYAFEGIGVVIPIIEVTENPKQFPKILLAVLITDMVLYTSFGEYCLFVYGDELEGKPLITMILEKGPIVWAIKILFSVNVIVSITLQAFPANQIMESYIYKGMKRSLMKTWLVNLQRAALIGGAIFVCIMLDNSLDKFNSLIGTFAATPVAFTIPCLMHYKLCSPTLFQKVLNILIIIFSMFVLVFCSGFTLWTWNE